MSFTDVFRAAREDEGGFDENERADLELHVRQCGRRYRALDRKLNLVVRLIIVILVLYIANVPGAIGALRTIVGLH